LRDQILEALKGMKTMFKDLTLKQSDALTRPLDKPFSDSILRMFAETTKQDLIMNNYVVRSKALKSTAGSVKLPNPKSKSKKDKSKNKPAKPAKKGGTKAGKTSPSKPGKGKVVQERQNIGMFPAEQHSEDDTGLANEADDDDDLAAELFVGFQTGADSAERVVRIAQVAARKLKKQGAVEPALKDLAACGPGGSRVGHNASRNLHRLISRTGRYLPVAAYPVLKPSSWVSYALSIGGEPILGGHSLQSEGACNMLANFWKKYSMINPECPVFTRPDYSREFASRLIPMAIHGDEGPDYVNSSG
ncbi:unnamed protein product, partial [Symbiodinium sp. CCMP2456]